MDEQLFFSFNLFFFFFKVRGLYRLTFTSGVLPELHVKPARIGPVFDIFLTNLRIHKDA